jgi:isoleucyl-tRNA synthetase
MAEFPDSLGIETLLDAELLARWDRLLDARSEVNRALEVARQDKIIGTSLAAHVTLRARGEMADLLESYRDQLPMLFIVSQLDLVRGAGEGVSLEVSVERAEGEKCPRCWRTVPTVSSVPDTLGLCDRCVGALPAGSRS